MESSLNTELLAGMLKENRAGKGLREIANEIGGISFTTLSRIEKGKVPDVETFVKLCAWLKVPADTFIQRAHENITEVSNKQSIVAHLRAERELPKETINMLINVIDMAYKTK